MKLIPIKCKRCAAPIRIPERIRYATCQHCGTRLQIDSDGDCPRVLILDDLRQSIASMEAKTKDVMEAAEKLQREANQLRLRNDILRLERQIRQLETQWNGERARWLSRKGDEPSVLSAIVSAAIIGVVIISPATSLLAVLAIQLVDLAVDKRSIILVISLIAGATIVLITCLRIWKALRYYSVRRNYRQRRDSLQQRLESFQGQLDVA